MNDVVRSSKQNDFDADLARLTLLRARLEDARKYGLAVMVSDALFLVSFIDKLWKEYTHVLTPVETRVSPSVDELLANPPPGAEERLASAINTSARLETLSNQALVNVALDGCFTDTSTTADLVLHEMCSRLHPGWENEIPEDAPAAKASCGCLPSRGESCPNCSSHLGESA